MEWRGKVIVIGLGRLYLQCTSIIAVMKIRNSCSIITTLSFGTDDHAFRQVWGLGSKGFDSDPLLVDLTDSSPIANRLIAIDNSFPGLPCVDYSRAARGTMIAALSLHAEGRVFGNHRFAES
mmetsp:Transcript_33601/g.81405  ORF Transcript_33601/g.81405 Transcript_33601/m.81405 type:complete len:122 (+) Transcript_33601:1555-1920(+)